MVTASSAPYWRHLHHPLRACLLLVLAASVLHLLAVGTAGGIDQVASLTKFCTVRQVKNQINNLCEMYFAKEVDGNLCPHLCGEAGANFSVTSCVGFHYAKAVVFSANLFDQAVIFKASSLSKVWRRERTVMSGGRNVAGAVLDEKWTRAVNPAWTQPRLEELWDETGSPEYILLRLLEGRDVAPAVVGNCGGYFAVEKVEPIKYPSFFSSEDDAEKISRLRDALQVLDLLDRLESVGNLSYCDVKPEHFGLNPTTGRINILDADHLYPKEFIGDLVADGRSCSPSDHSSCAVRHCRSTCHMSSLASSSSSSGQGTCSGSGVSNSNLQRVCQMVFLGADPEVWKVRPGLLEGVATDLRAALRRCAEDGVTTVRELRTALEEQMKLIQEKVAVISS